MSAIIQNIIAFIGVAIISGLGYYMYYIDGSSILGGGGVGTVSESQQAARQKAAEFQGLIAEINAIELSSDIMNDERFLSLTDYTLPVSTDNSGRSNPFIAKSGTGR